MRYTFLFIIFCIACRTNNTPLFAAGIHFVKDSVGAMTDQISKDLFIRGPVAWLDYFEDSPDFYMASEHQVFRKN